MPQNRLILGDWNAICDICGLKLKASQLRKDWRGLMVCKEDYEQRHPQDFLRVRADDPSVPWTRPQGANQFTGPACFVWDIEAFAGLATAGCAQAGKVLPFTSIQLWALKFPPPAA